MKILIRPSLVGEYKNSEGTRFELRIIPSSYVTSGSNFHTANSVEELAATLQLTKVPTPSIPTPNPVRRLESTGITVNGLTLACGPEDRAKFSQMLVMLREAEELGSAPETVTIVEKDNTPHELTLSALRQLLVQYGVAYQAAWLASK